MESLKHGPEINKEGGKKRKQKKENSKESREKKQRKLEKKKESGKEQKKLEIPKNSNEKEVPAILKEIQNKKATTPYLQDFPLFYDEKKRHYWNFYESTLSKFSNTFTIFFEKITDNEKGNIYAILKQQFENLIEKK